MESYCSSIRHVFPKDNHPAFLGERY